MEEEVNLITFRTYYDFIEAHIIKGRLESENIECYLFDENINTINPLYNVTVGGIKLKIKNVDLVKANELIPETENFEFIDKQGNKIKCPECESTDFYTGFKSMKGIKGILSTVISLALMVFPIYYKTVYKCKKCGNEFKNEEEKNNNAQ